MNADEIFKTFKVTREDAECLARQVDLSTMESRSLQTLRRRAANIARKLRARAKSEPPRD